jgi:hypothetical protein
VIAESSSSLSVTWEPPEKDKRNGKIVSYTVCISHEESEPCFKNQTTQENMLVIDNLNASTKYYVRVLASTKVGPGPYGESEGKRTNGSKLCSCKCCNFVSFGIFNVHFNGMLQKSDVSLFPALLNTCYTFNELTFSLFRTTRGKHKWNRNYINFHTTDSFTKFYVSSVFILLHWKE